MNKKSSLLRRASLAAVLAAVPAAAAGVAIQLDLQRQGAESGRSEALRQAREASARLGRYVERLGDALTVVAEVPAIRNGEPAACTALLAQLKARFGERVLITANAADGWAVCSSAGAAPRSIRNGDRSSHILPLQTGAFSVGVWEPANGQRSSGLHLGLPVQAEGGIGYAGTLTAVVDPAQLAEVLRSVALPPGAELVVADRNDRVVVRVGGDGPGELLAGGPVPAALAAQLPAAPGVGTPPGTDAEAGRLVDAAGEQGSRRLMALAPFVPGTDGALRLAVSYDPNALPGAPPFLWSDPRRLGLALGGFALSLLVAFAGARILLGKPLAEALAAAAQRDPPRPGASAAAPDRGNGALLALALETGNLGAWEYDPATGAFDRSETFDAILGYARPLDRWTWRAFLRHVVPEDRAAAEAAFRALRAGPGSVSHEVRAYREGDGALRSLVVRAVHHRAPDGTARIFGVLADTTDAVGASATDAYGAPTVTTLPTVGAAVGEAIRMSSDDLSHRVRGMLATVQGIAAETLRAPPGSGGLIPAAAKAAFESRLAALARCHEALMREDGARADVSELIDLVLAPYAAGRPAARHTASGPALWLPAATAVPLSVALHELATNAARHGSLSQPKGRVAVSWRLEEVGRGQAPMLRLRWEEQGGLELAGPPRRRGFGLKLLETGLAPEIGGLVSLEYPAAGLVCEIEAPLKVATPAFSENV